MELLLIAGLLVCVVAALVVIDRRDERLHAELTASRKERDALYQRIQPNVYVTPQDAPVYDGPLYTAFDDDEAFHSVRGASS